MKPGTARIQFDISAETKRRLDAQMSWGDLKAVYNAITLDLINLLEKHDRRMVIAAIVSEEITLKDYIRGKRDGDSGRPEEVSDRDGSARSGADDTGGKKEKT